MHILHVIFAVEITVVGPTRSCILSMLNVCDVYARIMDILVNHAKTNCIFFPGLPLHFLNT